ncbi:unnamed protein product [Bursaphelenchus okinawaensis]|uniref:G_PROTEIN_RECEP_F1_2 domain-containing protein n=1 Tax=Bursaphelenchus okinawaensis TaxID=465554 RepID=A0A811L7F3_9BILA|nr:unnamed protein product [Bursaphelenchus okinawaensis]CAG9117947.1 unnamed protein product [Bursaphelenchus okinawaensis]
MMIANSVVDLLFAVNTMITMASVCFGPQLVYVITDNPLYPKTYLASLIGIGSHLFLMFLSVSMLPLKFIYRYGVMRNRPFSNIQLFGMFMVSFMLGALHGGACPFTFTPRSAYYDEILKKSLENPNAVVNGYLVGEVHEFNAMAMHFSNVFVIMAISYTFIILMIYLSKQTVTLQKNEMMTKQTAAVQRQITRIIYFQALYPVFVIGFPCLLFPIFVVQGKTVPYIGEWAMFSMHTPPLVNSLAVILCVPSYRRFVVHPFKSSRIDTSVMPAQSVVDFGRQ